MSSPGGAESRNGVGAARNNSGDEPRQSKRPKKETDQQKHLKAYKSIYYPSDPEFPDVGDRNGWVKPPILVFFNAKGGTLKTSHTWTTAHIMSSQLRGLKVSLSLGRAIIIQGPPNVCRCVSTYILT